MVSASWLGHGWFNYSFLPPSLPPFLKIAEIIRGLFLDFVPQIVFPRQSTTLWILHTSLISQHHHHNPRMRCLWPVWDPLIPSILHIWAPIEDTLYSKDTNEKFGDDLFVNGQLAGITIIQAWSFENYWLLKTREVAMFFLAGFTSPGTDIKASVLFWVWIQVLPHICLLGTNWSMNVREKAILFLQKYVSLLETILDDLLLHVTELLVSLAANLACGAFYLPC